MNSPFPLASARQTFGKTPQRGDESRLRLTSATRRDIHVAKHLRVISARTLDAGIRIPNPESRIVFLTQRGYGGDARGESEQKNARHGCNVRLKPDTTYGHRQKSICRLSLMKRGGMMPVGMRHPESVASR